VLLLGLVLTSAIAEVVSLGSVLPFLGILTAPEKVYNHDLIGPVIRILDVSSPEQLILPITVSFIVVVVVAALIRVLVLWVITRLTFSTGTDLSIEAYRRTLYQPYQIHVSRNSSEVISGITQKVNGAVFGVLLPFLTMINAFVLMLFILFALIAIDAMVAFIAIAGFGSAYMLIARFTRHRLRINSERIAHEQTQVIKALQEGLGGIRDVLLDGTQRAYTKIYGQADWPLKRALGSNVFVSGSPRFVMEALGMTLIAVLAYILSRQEGGLVTAMPVLGALALGAQRLLPSLQMSYSSWATISGNQVALRDAIELLEQPVSSELENDVSAPLVFTDAIRLESVQFRYVEDGPWILDGIDLTIPKGSRVGFVGSTGSGKSTMIDLLMGLLTPDEGLLKVDNQIVDIQHQRAWQRNIGHVPQAIYLADATLAENIAFGVSLSEIDMDRVQWAARLAQLDQFIEGRAYGYLEKVGERGIRLSGGQRQRIGIARALYKHSNVLVLDEATSALDNITEQAVMKSIEGLGDDLTVLIIAHRLTTVENCDMIVELVNGKVVAQGSYQQLLKSSQSFRQLIQTAEYSKHAE